MVARVVERGELAAAGRAALPLVAGYLPAAVAFGVAAREAGLSVAEATGMSAIVLSGASQFALVGLISAGAPGPTAAITALFLSLRHLLYGPALAPRLRNFGPGRAALGALVLTDEIFALASGRGKPVRFGWLMGLELAACTTWVGGTWLGAYGGAAVVRAIPSLAPALSFALPALFAALLVPILIKPGREMVVTVLAAGAVAALLLLSGFGNWSVLAAGILGPAAGLLLGRRRA
jgi:predicted branched-subunit amino acid permease